LPYLADYAIYHQARTTLRTLKKIKEKKHILYKTHTQIRRSTTNLTKPGTFIL